MRFFVMGCILSAFHLLAPRVSAGPLSDTIWEGVQVISSINLQGMRDRVLMNYPVLRGGRTVLPLEIWFWDDSHFGIVFRNDRYDPARAGRKGDYLGWDYDGTQTDYTLSYEYSFKNNRGSFLGKSVRIVNSPWGWGYAGAMWQFQGKFSVKGNKLTTEKVSSATDSFDMQAGQAYEDPGHPGTYFPSRFDGFRFLDKKYPVFENTVWTKTSRRPSFVKNQAGYISD